MALFDSQSLNRLRHVWLATRQAGGGILAGPRARLPAGGTEITGHRDYSPGDDYRQVDWSLCARHDELRVKQYEGEADRPVYLLLDCSARFTHSSKISSLLIGHLLVCVVGVPAGTHRTIQALNVGRRTVHPQCQYIEHSKHSNVHCCLHVVPPSFCSSST